MKEVLGKTCKGQGASLTPSSWHRCRVGLLFVETAAQTTRDPFSTIAGDANEAVLKSVLTFDPASSPSFPLWIALVEGGN